MPARHALGALQAEQGLHAEAIAVYKQDLAQGGGRPGPANPWALAGLVTSLEAVGADAAEVEAAKAELARVSESADTDVRASCACAAMAKGCGCEDKASI